MRSVKVFAVGIAAAACLWAAVGAADAADQKKGKKVDIHSLTMKDIDGKEVQLSKYKGKLVLFVNVASQCGLTPQYAGLQQLHEKYAAKGLRIVGVPANEFAGQEPGSDHEIKQFCTGTYSVSFDMLSKVVVKGRGICPLYEILTKSDAKPKGAGEVSWNFEKFLVNGDGKVVARFSPRTEPNADELTRAIEANLPK